VASRGGVVEGGEAWRDIGEIQGRYRGDLGEICGGVLEGGEAWLWFRFRARVMARPKVRARVGVGEAVKPLWSVKPRGTPAALCS